MHRVQSQSQASDVLATVTARLAATPTKQLPHVMAHIARSLSQCRTLLSSPDTARAKGSADALALHKLKTRVGALLQDKTTAGRYAATVLVKTIVDVGGHEQLKGSIGWVRGLLSILGRASEPPSSRKLALVALTRIFLLTHDHQSLVRELTTPTLPAFVTSCLNVVSPKTPPTKAVQVTAQRQLLEPVLESFARLVPNHPNIFRPFLSQISVLVTPLLAPTPSEASNDYGAISGSVRCAAQSLFVLLPACAPKSTASNGTSATGSAVPDPWTAAVKCTIDAIHTTTDLVFRAIAEEWRSVAGVVAQPDAPRSLEGDLFAADGACLVVPQIRATGLPGWRGVHAGSERLVGLLQLLEAFLQGETSGVVELPLGCTVDVLTRILSVAVPPPGNSRSRRSAAYAMRLNAVVDQEEKLGLWSELPSIHAAASRVVSVLVSRLGSAALPVSTILFNQLLHVFGAESNNALLREAVYEALTEIVELAGTSFVKAQVKPLSLLVESACGDVLPDSHAGVGKGSRQVVTAGKTPNKKAETNLNVDGLFKGPNSIDDQTSAPLHAVSDELQNAAHDFLVVYTAVVASRHMSATSRALIDRTAILASDPEIMLASVVNPPYNDENATKSRSSILPHLARAFPERLDVEALLRPRMPAVSGNQSGDLVEDADDDGQADADDDDEEVEDDGSEQDDQKINNISNQADDIFAKKPRVEASSSNTADSGPSHRRRRSIDADDIHRAKRLGKRTVSPMNSDEEREEKRIRMQEMEQSLPATVPVLEPESQNSDRVTVSGPTTRAQANMAAESDKEDDDDDFVMPTLTMDPDTEDEDD